MVEEIADGTHGSRSRSHVIASLLGRQNTYHLVEPASNQKEYKFKSGRTIVYWNFLEVRNFEPFFPKTEKAKKANRLVFGSLASPNKTKRDEDSTRLKLPPPLLCPPFTYSS